MTIPKICHLTDLRVRKSKTSECLPSLSSCHFSQVILIWEISSWLDSHVIQSSLGSVVDGISTNGKKINSEQISRTWSTKDRSIPKFTKMCRFARDELLHGQLWRARASLPSKVKTTAIFLRRFWIIQSLVILKDYCTQPWEQVLQCEQLCKSFGK